MQIVYEGSTYAVIRGADGYWTTESSPQFDASTYIEQRDENENIVHLRAVGTDHDDILWLQEVDSGGYVGKHIEYDVRRKTIEVLKMQDVADAQNYGETILYASGKQVYEFTDSAVMFAADEIEAYWFTPESDLGLPSAEKTLESVYFTGWGSKADGTDGGRVKITAFYKRGRTERKKERVITLPTERRVIKSDFMVSGRLFKFKFENADGSAVNMSNLQFVFEINED